LSAAKTEQQKQFGAQVLASYKASSPSQLQLLLSQNDPALLSRMAYYNAILLNNRQTQIDSYQATLTNLDKIEPEITAQTLQLANSQSRLSEKHKALKASQSERKKTLAKLNASIDAKDAQLQKSAADRAHLEKILSEVVKQLSDVALGMPGEPFQARKGKMGWPTKGHINASFGSARAGNRLRWQGVMIAAPEGREVKAIHQGRVVFSEYMRGQGMLLIIDHGDNFLSLYAHNQALFKETGDWVSDGEVIARVGNSGGLDQANLYFEIRHQGKPLNPSHWCRG
jgi:septal ring factor EnvC (AmiA/AmiB activator)